ncbi:MAG: Nudix family hydrolase [Burkholderiales bacterium]|nr:Nudix family hydrolase [Burkholderiales bacterium]
MKITHVAAAVFLRPDGTFLLAQRPEGKPYPGYWEFPGGKLEAGETPHDCLVRELKEELDVTITKATPWITRVHVYTHATVRLHFFRVTAWTGEFRGLEGQAHIWQNIHALDVSPMLPANTPVFRALSLPAQYAITDIAAMGWSEYSQRLERALDNGLRLIQLREKSLARAELVRVGRALVDLAREHGARVVVNSDHDIAAEIAADGLHLTSAALTACSIRPAHALVLASTHSRTELERAAQLELDGVVCGPVLTTASHPAANPMGWEGFAACIADPPLAVYALGGLGPQHLVQAQALGAHGVAYRRAL